MTKIVGSDPDPNPDTYPVVRGMDTRIRIPIRIHIKMAWIRNTVSQPPYLLVFLFSVWQVEPLLLLASRGGRGPYNAFQRKSALDNLFLFSINPGIFFLTPQQPTAINISSLSASLSSNFRSNFLHTYSRIFLWLSTIFVHPSLPLQRVPFSIFSALLFLNYKLLSNSLARYRRSLLQYFYN